jgi:nicotinamidase-related amidase
MLPSEASSLPQGRLTVSAAHLCIDMQQMFAEQTAWHVPWMKRVLPAILQIACAFPERTVFTRFIPPMRAEEAKGVWRQYYRRWDEFTRERLSPHLLELLPELMELVPRHSGFDGLTKARLQPRQIILVHQDSDCPRPPRLARDQAEVLQGDDHAMHGWRRDLEEPHHLVFGWRLAVNQRVGVDEREILTL